MPIVTAGVMTIIGIVGALGALDAPIRAVTAKLQIAADRSRSVRQLLFWPIVTTLIAVPSGLFMLSGKPNLVGLVPLAGVALAWLGTFARRSSLTRIGL